MQDQANRLMKSGLMTLLVLGSAVAAFGLTFHFFGQSEIVPAPSKQFGFVALAPLGIMDKIYYWLFHERLYWHPIPMFLCLWITYSLMTMLVAWLFTRKKVL